MRQKFFLLLNKEHPAKQLLKGASKGTKKWDKLLKQAKEKQAALKAQLVQAKAKEKNQTQKEKKKEKETAQSKEKEKIATPFSQPWERMHGSILSLKITAELTDFPRLKVKEYQNLSQHIQEITKKLNNSSCVETAGENLTGAITSNALPVHSTTAQTDVSTNISAQWYQPNRTKGKAFSQDSCHLEKQMQLQELEP